MIYTLSSSYEWESGDDLDAYDLDEYGRGEG